MDNLPKIIFGFLIVGLILAGLSINASINEVEEKANGLEYAIEKLQDLTFGAPANFIATPATTSPRNFSFTVGTSTSLSAFGTTTLAVYGSTTIQTPINTLHAFEVFNAASTTVFRVDSVNGTASTTNLIVSGLNAASCDVKGGSDGTLSCGTDSTGSTVFPFDTATNYGTTTNGTTTPLWMRGSLYSLFASSTAVFTNASSSQLTVTGAVDLDTFTSALLLTGSGGDVAEYAGTSCTNQFVRSLSALGAATCATVGTADVSGLDISDDTNLAATWPVILTGDTLSFGGLSTSSAPTIGELPYWTGVNTFGSVATGTVTNAGNLTFSSAVRSVIGGALTIAVDLTSNFAWTGAHDFGGATSIEVANGTGPTVDAIGEIALDTTNNELLYATSTNSAAPAVLKPFTTISFGLSTSTAGSGTTTLELGPAAAALYLDEIQCGSDTFYRVVIEDASGNRVNDLVASSTVGTVKFTTNNSFTSGERMIASIGTTTAPTGSREIGCRVKAYYTRN